MTSSRRPPQRKDESPLKVADDGENSMTLLMDTSLPPRRFAKRSTLDGRLSARLPPSPLKNEMLDELDDSALERLAWEAVESHAYTASASCSPATMPQPAASSSAVKLVQLSPNVETRRKRSPRKSLAATYTPIDSITYSTPSSHNSFMGSVELTLDGDSTLKEEVTVEAPIAVRETREERRKRLGLDDEVEAAPPAISAQTPAPPPSSVKRRLPSMLEFSPYKDKKSKRDALLKHQEPSSSPGKESKSEQSSHLVDALRQARSPAEKGKQGSGARQSRKVSGLPRASQLPLPAGSQSRSLSAFRTSELSKARRTARNTVAASRHLPEDVDNERDDMEVAATGSGGVEISEAADQPQDGFEQQNESFEATSQNHFFESQNVEMKTEDEVEASMADVDVSEALIGEDPPEMEMTQPEMTPTLETPECSPSRPRSSLRRSARLSDSSRSTTQNVTVTPNVSGDLRSSPRIPLPGTPEAPKRSSARRRSSSRPVNGPVELTSQIAVQAIKEQKKPAIRVTRRPVLFDGASHAAISPRKPSRRADNVPSGTVDVPAGFRLTSTGSLVRVPVPDSSTSKRFASSTMASAKATAEQFERLLAAADDQEKKLKEKRRSKAHETPEYLKMRKLELEREREDALRRQIEAIRAKELGLEGAGKAKYKALPSALQGARPRQSTMPQNATSSGAFVSATSARQAERASWEAKRVAREALLESERLKAREERERKDAEELKKERARRIPKANPIPEGIYGTRMVATTTFPRRSVAPGQRLGDVGGGGEQVVQKRPQRKSTALRKR